MSAADNEDLPPPLEDMSDYVARLNKVRCKNESVAPQPVYLPKPSQNPLKQTGSVCPKQQIEELQNTSKKTSGSFCGFSAGFLNKAPKKTTKTMNQRVKSNNIPFVRQKTTDSEYIGPDLRLPEVQAAMKKTIDKKEWLNNDLFSRIGANPKLMKGFMNPRIQGVITEIQKNPKAAAKKFENDPEISEFLKGFMSMMGDHFNDMGEKEKNQTSSKYD